MNFLERGSMNYELAIKIYEAMKAEELDLLPDVLRAAIRYSQIRAEWMLMTIEDGSLWSRQF
jgi:hypothetical protein